MNDLRESIRKTAREINFSGVISARLDAVFFQEAWGYRDRPNKRLNTSETRFAIASGTKGFTAVAVARLIADKLIEFDTLAADLLAGRIKGLHPGITVRHLLGHTSGIGDYLDEATITDIEDVPLPATCHLFESPGDYLPLIEKAERQSLPGEKFAYSNSGYVLLALVIELVSGQPYGDFIQQAVFDPAGMARSGFFRSDNLPADTAIGYLRGNDSQRSNLLHLPIRGCGDGGAYTTADDMDRFWDALLQGRLLPDSMFAELTAPRLHSSPNKLWYGYGFWLNDNGSIVSLEGYDAGVSFRSLIQRDHNLRYNVLSNTRSGAWPLVRVLDTHHSC